MKKDKIHNKEKKRSIMTGTTIAKGLDFRSPYFLQSIEEFFINHTSFLLKIASWQPKMRAFLSVNIERTFHFDSRSTLKYY